MFPCPCCNCLTISEQPPGTFKICPVCHWEDDAAQFEDLDLRGGANDVSLKDARKNYQQFGTSDERFTNDVREATPDEKSGREDGRT